MQCGPCAFEISDLIYMRTTIIQTIHKHAHRLQWLCGPPAQPPQGAQRERRGRRQGDARVRASCTRRRLIRRRRLPRANKGLPPFASSTSRSPSKSAAAIEPVIALPRGSVMLVGKVPSPALSSTRPGLPLFRSSTRLGLPSFPSSTSRLPSSTSRLPSPSTSAAAIEPRTSQGR